MKLPVPEAMTLPENVAWPVSSIARCHHGCLRDLECDECKLPSVVLDDCPLFEPLTLVSW